MTEEYKIYLDSDAWKAKRSERLKMDGFKCSACMSVSKLDIHHLTYDRVFNENLDDLITLCRFHHDAIEDLISRGILTRIGDVRFLAGLTVGLLTVVPSRVAKVVKTKNPKTPSAKDIQLRLLGEFWLTEALRLPRSEFKHLVNKRFPRSLAGRNRMVANSLCIYDRKHRYAYQS